MITHDVLEHDSEGCRAALNVRPQKTLEDQASTAEDGRIISCRIWPSSMPVTGASKAEESGLGQGFVRTRASGRPRSKKDNMIGQYCKPSEAHRPGVVLINLNAFVRSHYQ